MLRAYSLPKAAPAHAVPKAQQGREEEGKGEARRGALAPDFCIAEKPGLVPAGALSRQSFLYFTEVAISHHNERREAREGLQISASK